MKIYSSEYKLVNRLFLIVVGSIFIYSILFDPEKMNYPIHSLCNKYDIPVKKCKSKGLSRSFSYLVRLKIDKARNLNKYSVKLFLFFLLQLVFRLFVEIFYNSLGKKIWLYDIIFSLIGFVYAFYPFLSSSFTY